MFSRKQQPPGIIYQWKISGPGILFSLRTDAARAGASPCFLRHFPVGTQIHPLTRQSLDCFAHLSFRWPLASEPAIAAYSGNRLPSGCREHGRKAVKVRPGSVAVYHQIHHHGVVGVDAPGFQLLNLVVELGQVFFVGHQQLIQDPLGILVIFHQGVEDEGFQS